MYILMAEILLLLCLEIFSPLGGGGGTTNLSTCNNFINLWNEQHFIILNNSFEYNNTTINEIIEFRIDNN